MDREAWRAVVHGVSKNRTWLSNWTELIRDVVRYQLLEDAEALGAIVMEQDAKAEAREY